MLRLCVKLALSLSLAFGVIEWVESGITCSQSNHTAVRSELLSIKNMLEMQALISKSGTLPAGYLPGNDPWGRPYQWSAPESRKGSDSDLLVYSLGKDGTTASQGNDPDDINSKDDHHLGYYTQEARWNRLRGYFLTVVLLGTPAFFAIDAIEIGWKSIRRRSSRP
jgi:hypothetical protein